MQTQPRWLWRVLATRGVGRLAVCVLALLHVAASVGVSPSVPVQGLAVPLANSLDEYARFAMSGGPGKDGIPAIDEPRFVSAAEADRFLESEDVVFGVINQGTVKGYPQKILVWHEIVNDRIAGENVSVTYCPLTGTAIGFKAGDSTFGVSGDLVNSNLIMYDRATDSRWPQMLATAVEGEYRGRSLHEFRVVWSTWGRWKQAYPEIEVLSQDTGYARNYDRDPYGTYNPVTGYYALGNPPFFPLLKRDSRLDPKAVVIGARADTGAFAFRKSTLREQGSVEGTVGDLQYTAFYDPQLDTAYVYRNPDGVTFTYEGGRHRGAGGIWHADEIPLESINAFDAMWFAWAAFYPATALYD